MLGLGTLGLIASRVGSFVKGVIADGLVMRLPFASTDVSATTQTTPNISGNDNNAILKTGKALVFAGNDSVETVFPSSKDIKTIAFWIYPTHSASGETLFYFGGAGQGTKFLYLNNLTLRKDSFGGMDFSVYVDGVYRGNTYESSNYVTLAQDQWQRVVLVTSTAKNTISNTFDVAYKGFGSYGRFKMSDLQIYGAEFTTDDIAYDYANPQKLVTDNASSNVTLNDLHAWWHMSEGDGTISFDSAPLFGKELLNNPINETNWTLDEGWTTDNGIATRNGGSVVSTYLRQSISGLVNGNVYKVSFTISNLSTPITTIGISSSGFLGNVSAIERFVTENGDFSITGTFDNQRVNPTELRFVGGTNTTFSVSNVSVKEVYNVDGETYDNDTNGDGTLLGATYDDAQERIPQLGMMNWSKGSNLLTYSEDFSEWTQYGSPTIVQNIISPDGTLTGTQLTRGSNQTPLRFRTITTLNQEYTFSVYAKKGSVDAFRLDIGDEAYTTFTLTDEWQRFTVTSTPTTNTHIDIGFAPSVSGDDIYIWGAQLEESSSATAYRRTNGTAVTDATLISSATDSQKDILGNAVRARNSSLSLDGTGYAELMSDNVFDIPAISATEGDFSICGWAKWNYVQQPNLSTMNTIFSNGRTLGTSDTFSVNTRFDGSTNKVRAYVNGSHINSTTTYSVGEWFYFALTRKKNAYTNNITLYVSKIDSNGDWVVTSEDVGTNNNGCTNSNDKTIGWDRQANDRKYHDLIDDIKFYDRELSLTEIQQNFNATKSAHTN